MAALKDYLIVAGFVSAIAYGGWASHSKKEAVRANLMSTNGLSSAEAPALQACLQAVERKKLTMGGSPQSFCGCFVQRATTVFNDGHKQLAVQTLADVMDKSQSQSSPYPEASFAGRVSNAASAVEHVRSSAVQCASLQRTSFTSEQQHRSWCGAHAGDLSKDDPRCRNLDGMYRKR